ncbi:tetratricopeptide repeat protein [Roseofilum capinflatum]|uniref:Tetratricopeptide repeat protein n=1 Tax=Roseofilum capinflatum BLCC-M114 TaxID=3022440 RepID=A0ABT7B634_9CYAN|nr:tetratricopeptide repeat protein [Roseofilum capinflatum]MDJ1174624.1 tetratricopeptide repeat protein [Roseofilum capinflatum BLCC-M114]
MNLLWKGLLIVVILVASIILPAQAISMREFPHQVWDQESATPRLISAVDESRNLEDVAQEAFTAANQGDFATAEADWTQILEAYPESAAAWSNRGITRASQGKFEGAIADYKTCNELAPNFAFALASQALATYELGETEQAIKMMRNLNRKYPQFADMRAALSAALWVEGKQGEAESNWVAAVGLDSRYKDMDWVKNIRRWPPTITEALERFLSLS